MSNRRLTVADMYPSFSQSFRNYPSNTAVERYMRRRKTTYKRKRFTPGLNRTGGFYGRFSGLNAEMKFHDLSVAQAVFSATGTISSTSLNVISQGVGEAQRVGRKCTIKSINWHWVLRLFQRTTQATPPTADTVRMIIYLDRQCNGAAATVLGILETAQFQSFRNLANTNRFQILYDKTKALNYLSVTSDIDNEFNAMETTFAGSFYKKVNIPIEYDSTSGTIGEIRSNNLGVLTIAENGLPGLTSRMRLRFSDF